MKSRFAIAITLVAKEKVATNVPALLTAYGGVILLSNTDAVSRFILLIRCLCIL